MINVQLLSLRLLRRLIIIILKYWLFFYRSRFTGVLKRTLAQNATRENLIPEFPGGGGGCWIYRNVSVIFVTYSDDFPLEKMDSRLSYFLKVFFLNPVESGKSQQPKPEYEGLDFVI